MPEPQIKGLPAGAELRPISGLPPGAELRPIGQQSTPAPPPASAPAAPPSMLDRAMTGLGHFGIGLGRGVAETSKNIGGLEHAVMPQAIRNTGYGKNFEAGLDTLTGWSQPNPEHPSEAVGKGVEQAAEFLIPGGAEEEGAAKLATMAPKLGKFAKPIAKALTSALGSGAVNALQGGSPLAGAAMGAGGSLAGDALKAAAPAVGKIGRFLSATPESQQLAITRQIKPGTALQAFGDALKPTQLERPDFISNFGDTFPKIATATPQGVSDVAQTAQAEGTKQLKDFANLRKPFRNAPVDMTGVPRAQLGSINKLDTLEHPGIESRTAETAGRYVPDTAPKTMTSISPILDERGNPIVTEKIVPGEKPTTMRDVDALRRQTNQKLQPFYQKAEGNKYAARANPEVRRLEASGNALRNTEYGTLSSLSGTPEEDIRAGQNRYGAFKDLGDIANRQSNRMLTTTDPSNISGVDVFRPKNSLLRYVGNRLVGDVDSPNALVRSAVDRFYNPAATPMPMSRGIVKPIIRGMTNAATGTMNATPRLVSPFATGAMLQKDRNKKE